MLKRLFPHQENFFSQFQELADELQKAANHFQQMLNDLPSKTTHVQAIKTHQHKAGKLARSLLEILHKTFITPFDRHDIHELTREFCYTFDLINQTSQRILIYKIKAIPSEVCSLGALCACAAALIKAAIEHLDSLKNSANILKLCKELNDLYTQSDKILLTGVTQLFRDVSDVKQLFIMREIYDYSEAIIKKFQSLANIIERLVLEYS